MYSLSADSGLNGGAIRTLSSANTHKRNFVFNPWTAGNPCSPRTDGKPYIRLTHTHTHTHRYASVHILPVRLHTSLQLVYV